MVSVREYLTTLLVVSAVTAVLGLLPSEGGVRRAVSFGLAVAVLSVTLLPLPGLLSSAGGELSGVLDRLEESESEENGFLLGKTIAAVEEGIAAHLCERYGIKEGALSVSCDGDIVDGTLLLRRVTLSLSPSAATADVPSIVRYIENNTGADCEVIYREA